MVQFVSSTFCMAFLLAYFSTIFFYDLDDKGFCSLWKYAKCFDSSVLVYNVYWKNSWTWKLMNNRPISDIWSSAMIRAYCQLQCLFQYRVGIFCCLVISLFLFQFIFRRCEPLWKWMPMCHFNQYAHYYTTSHAGLHTKSPYTDTD